MDTYHADRLRHALRATPDLVDTVDDGDVYGSLMLAFFAIADELAHRGHTPPDEWGYRPGIGTTPDDDDLYRVAIANTPSTALVTTGRRLDRLHADVVDAGLSY